MQYLYARSKIDSWIGNICHCLCNNPHATSNKKLLLCLFHFLSAATTHHLPFSLCTPSLWLLVPFQLQLLLKRGMILHLSSLPQQSRNPWRILSSYNSESYISTTFIQPKKTTKSSPSRSPSFRLRSSHFSHPSLSPLPLMRFIPTKSIVLISLLLQPLAAL